MARSTLADANELRDWRIFADFAQKIDSQDNLPYSANQLNLFDF